MKIESTQTKIEHSAAEAIAVINRAASEAAKGVSEAATRVVNTKFDGDHDLLIELKTRMEGLKADIKELSDGTKTQISEHEVRINILEDSKTKQTTLLSIGIGILSILVSLLIYHLLGQ